MVLPYYSSICDDVALDMKALSHVKKNKKNNTSYFPTIDWCLIHSAIYTTSYCHLPDDV